MTLTLKRPVAAWRSLARVRIAGRTWLMPHDTARNVPCAFVVRVMTKTRGGRTAVYWS